MKNPLHRSTLVTILTFAALPAAWGVADPNAYATVIRPPTNVVLTIVVTPPKEVNPTPLAPATAGPAAPLPGTTATAQWVDLKDYPYAQRATILAGLQGLETRVATQIEELNAKRATLTGTTRTDEWDFAMKEMYNARSQLKFACEELGKATPESWSQQRDRVGQAWERTQDAYARVKASTTT